MDLGRAGFQTETSEDIGPVPHGKLLTSLAGALQALCGGSDGVWALARQVAEEGEAVFRAAGGRWIPVDTLRA